MKKRILVTGIITLIFQISYSQISNKIIRDNFREFTFKSEVLQRDMSVLI